ncbi:MAG: winged helix-turn-helix domain-containing protein [Alphaproteobacteria bacterium]|nr:winged helix-turn-helix domain-containing protein [Alphaproteobacteria bacterium]
MKRLALRACVIDVEGGTATFAGGREERLTPRELQLLLYLAERQDRIVSRAELLEQVWGTEVVSRAVDTAMRRLREKVEAEPAQPDHLITAFGDGYRFVPGPDATPEPALVDDEPFVGRQTELAQVNAWLEQPGSAQLVGPPGAGKTRLARRACVLFGGALGASVGIVDLTDARDLAQVAHALVVSLGVEGPATATEALTRAGHVLRAHGNALWVLDNCEGAPEAVGEAAEALVRAAPGLRLLLTSRAPIPGDPDRILPVPELARDEAVELFELQARRVRPGFTVGEQRDVVEALVDRLDRIPLAVVLAAGRAGALSPRAMLDRLDDRFRLLQSRDRDAPLRQRTLRAALDGSWELLSAGEKDVFTACSVFRGGYDLAAAEQVVGRPDTADLLRSLARRFLVEPRGDRFGGYAFVRDYAAERLAEDPDREEEVARRHGSCFRDRALAVPTEQRPRLLSADRPNLTEAALRAVPHGRPDVAATCALAALDVIGREGPYELGVDMAREVLRLDGLPDADAAVLHIRLAALEQSIGASDGADLLVTARVLAERSGDPSVVVEVHRAKGAQLRHRGQSALAVEACEAALPLARELGGTPLFFLLSTLASALRDIGKLEEAYARWCELESLTRDERNHGVRTYALSGMCIAERRWGRIAEAEAHARESVAVSRAMNERRGETLARMLLGNLLLEDERWDEASAEYAAALRLARELGQLDTAAKVHGNIGIAALRAGDLDAAEEHLRAAESEFERMSEPRQVMFARANLGRIAAERGDLAEGVALIEEAVAWMRGVGDGASEAEALSVVVVPYLRLGRVADARAAVDRMEALVRGTRNPMVLATALARRGLVELAEGRDASATLAEIDALGLTCRPTSDTGAAVEDLRRRLDVDDGR